MNLARTVVAVGSSAGGVQALIHLVSHLPRDLAAAVLLVQHVHPQGPRLLAGILDRTAAMPVAYGERHAPVLPGHIYVAQPGSHMRVERPGCTALSLGPKENFSRPAVDVLFRSVAEVYGRRAIGVVLTGYGSDGTKGLNAIHEGGGVSVVQEPWDAEVASMPMSALIGDSPDHACPLRDLPALLIRLVRRINFGQAPDRARAA